MEYRCFICNDIFSSQRIIFQHLKKFHLIQDHTQDLECIIKFDNSKCRAKFETYSGLRKHIKKYSGDSAINIAEDTPNIGTDTIIEATKVINIIRNF